MVRPRFRFHSIRCILFLYHALGEQENEHNGPTLASMDFSAAGKKASGRGKGRYKLIVASNRDEDLDRSATPIHFWKDADSNILAGMVPNFNYIRDSQVNSKFLNG